MSYKINFNSTYANRGMGLENDINETNKYYLTYDIALIYKKPTPIRITKTNYKDMRITDGFFETQSTLDYNGVYKGYYIEFDAKETNSSTSFPISNIHEHQLAYIRKVFDDLAGNILGLKFEVQITASNDNLDKLVKSIIDVRNTFKANKQYEYSDLIRDKLKENAISIIDTKDGAKIEF